MGQASRLSRPHGRPGAVGIQSPLPDLFMHRRQHPERACNSISGISQNWLHSACLARISLSGMHSHQILLSILEESWWLQEFSGWSLHSHRRRLPVLDPIPGLKKDAKANHVFFFSMGRLLRPDWYCWEHLNWKPWFENHQISLVFPFQFSHDTILWNQVCQMLIA